MSRTVFWTLWERARVEWYGTMALKHVNYHMWNGLPVQVRCMRQGARSWCTGMTQRDGMGRERGGGFRMENTCIPMVYVLPVQFSSVAQSCLTLRPHGLQHARPPCPSPTPRVYSKSCPLSQWCHPTISSSCRPLLLLPSIFPIIRVFSNESALHIRWPKYWSFSFNPSPSDEYSGLISFRMDWFVLLAVQGSFKGLLQCHSSKASILWLSTFFIVQFSHPYVTTGKTIVLTRWTFVGKVVSLLFNMLSRLVITFLPRSKLQSISWL